MDIADHWTNIVAMKLFTYENLGAVRNISLFTIHTDSHELMFVTYLSSLREYLTYKHELGIICIFNID